MTDEHDKIELDIRSKRIPATPEISVADEMLP